MKTSDISLYIHIPYCVKKCLYCDFLSYPLSSCQGKEAKKYLSCLKKEIAYEGAVYRDRTVSSVFFGGGTPSSLPEGEIAALMEVLNGTFRIDKEAEITIECNPGTVNAAKLEEYRRAGINRLSFGLQSVHDAELRLLGRIHTYKEFEENYRMAGETGFQNINVDLMSGLPAQSVSSWEDTLRRVAELAPQHISAYSLIIEEGTLFYERYGEEARRPDYAAGLSREAAKNAVRAETEHKTESEDAGAGNEKRSDTELPDEETEREMVHATTDILSEYGYYQYEISNYAKSGHECRHNLVYWRRGDYLGLGLGAASCVDEVRWKNTSELEKYLNRKTETEKAAEEEEILSAEDRCFEAVMLGLRLNEGIDLAEYKKRYGVDLCVYKAEWLDKMTYEGLLVFADHKIRLTQRGRDLMDYVLREF